MSLIGVYPLLAKKVSMKIKKKKKLDVHAFFINIVTSMLLGLLNICSQEELAATAEEKAMETPVIIVPDNDMSPEQRRQIIKNKILAIGKISRTFSVLRENSELVMELKNLSGTGKLPKGTLGLGSEGIRKGKEKKCELLKEE